MRTPDSAASSKKSSLSHDALTPLSLGETSPPNSMDDVTEVVDEAGYLRVGIRVRPLGAGRGEQSNDLVVSTEKGTIEHKDNKYRFAHVFKENDDNGDIFEKVGRPIVGAVTNGYNGTLFAYGQTGSGKTHTMLGYRDTVAGPIADDEGQPGRAPYGVGILQRTGP